MAQLDANGDDHDDNSDNSDVDQEKPILCHLSASAGAAHEKNYQHNLEQAYFALKRNTSYSVKVHLRAEPLNPFDPSAIAIDLEYGTGSSHVGYIASELCKYLHPLMTTADIIGVICLAD